MSDGQVVVAEDAVAAAGVAAVAVLPLSLPRDRLHLAVHRGLQPRGVRPGEEGDLRRHRFQVLLLREGREAHEQR